MPSNLRVRSSALPFICSRCQFQKSATKIRPPRQTACRTASTSTRSSTTSGFFPPSTETQHPAYVNLSNRSVIKLQGPDVFDFLNGLLPAKIQPVPKESSTPTFTTLLSAKGRILYEAFIYPPTESEIEGPWYIDVDGSSASALFSHLKKHKLRSKFKLEKVDAQSLGVYYVWPSQENESLQVQQPGGQDPRPLMGLRFLSNPSDLSPALAALQERGTTLSLSDYHIHRIISGHAEGSTELIPHSALPQESNIDFDGGIDFHKGCYLGQELTIRTHHTGLVRKRILPCQICPGDQNMNGDQDVAIYDASVSVFQPPSEANISKKHAKGRSGRSTGKWLGGVGNVGLALCRLEMMTDIQLTAEGTSFDPDAEFIIVWEDGEADADGKTALREVKVKPFVPEWLRKNIQAGINARSERTKKRKQEEDEDEEEVD